MIRKEVKKEIILNYKLLVNNILTDVQLFLKSPAVDSYIRRYAEDNLTKAEISDTINDFVDKYKEKLDKLLDISDGEILTRYVTFDSYPEVTENIKSIARSHGIDPDMLPECDRLRLIEIAHQVGMTDDDILKPMFDKFSTVGITKQALADQVRHNIVEQTVLAEFC